MSYRIPVGPYHIALEEPYKIEVECEGERVTGAVSYTHLTLPTILRV